MTTAPLLSMRCAQRIDDEIAAILCSVVRNRGRAAAA